MTFSEGRFLYMNLDGEIGEITGGGNVYSREVLMASPVGTSRGIAAIP